VDPDIVLMSATFSGWCSQASAMAHDVEMSRWDVASQSVQVCRAVMPAVPWQLLQCPLCYAHQVHITSSCHNERRCE
jgi:hypothetical protein